MSDKRRGPTPLNANIIKPRTSDLPGSKPDQHTDNNKNKNKNKNQNKNKKNNGGAHVGESLKRKRVEPSTLTGQVFVDPVFRHGDRDHGAADNLHVDKRQRQSASTSSVARDAGEIKLESDEFDVVDMSAFRHSVSMMSEQELQQQVLRLSHQRHLSQGLLGYYKELCSGLRVGMQVALSENSTLSVRLAALEGADRSLEELQLQFDDAQINSEMLLNQVDEMAQHAAEARKSAAIIRTKMRALVQSLQRGGMALTSAAIPAAATAAATASSTASAPTASSSMTSSTTHTTTEATASSAVAAQADDVLLEIARLVRQLKALQDGAPVNDDGSSAINDGDNDDDQEETLDSAEPDPDTDGFDAEAVQQVNEQLRRQLDQAEERVHKLEESEQHLQHQVDQYKQMIKLHDEHLAAKSELWTASLRSAVQDRELLRMEAARQVRESEVVHHAQVAELLDQMQQLKRARHVDMDIIAELHARLTSQQQPQEEQSDAGPRQLPPANTSLTSTAALAGAPTPFPSPEQPAQRVTQTEKQEAD